jgi:tRNA (Thr-GGU) A37 N-methylase
MNGGDNYDVSSYLQPIGLSIFSLERLKGTRLYIREVDIVDGTPVLDIKPYVP